MRYSSSEITLVAVPGPPPVRMSGTVLLLKLLMVSTMVDSSMGVLMSGSLMRISACQVLAPSTRAASNNPLSTPLSPAKIITME